MHQATFVCVSDFAHLHALARVERTVRELHIGGAGVPSMLRTSIVIGFFSVSSLATLGCSGDGSVPNQGSPDESALTADAGAAPAGAKLPNEVQWFRNSAEYQVLSRVTYKNAAKAVDDKVMLRKDPKAWGVVLDVDETVLDNSTYQKERGLQGLGYSPDSWNEWVQRKAAPAVPGAVSFTAHVHAAGGKVVLITNRDAAGCPATEVNLKTVGVVYDAILCTPDAAKTDKNPRFKAVQDGTSDARLPALDVLAYVGDNIQDFPDLDQSVRTGPEDKFDIFGQSYFVLPNPMYGSWAKNPQN